VRTYSQRVLFDDALWRLGLTEPEACWLMEAAIERMHAERRGELVRASVTVDEMGPRVSVCELAPYGSLREDREVRFRFQPSPDEFRRIVEDYGKTKTARAGWEIAQARCLEVYESYSVVELSENQRLDGETAILPRAMLAWADMPVWRRGQTRYVAVFQPRAEHVDGGQAWQALSPKWMATRRNSIFLRSLIQHFLGLPVRSEIVGDWGMVVVQPSGEVGRLIGAHGEHARALAELAGLRGISVVREVASCAPAKCIEKAIRSLTPLRSGFTLIPPEQERGIWTIVVPDRFVKVLVGANGYRLTMISRLAQLRVRLLVREQLH
jgi:hypothetical protein